MTFTFNYFLNMNNLNRICMIFCLLAGMARFSQAQTQKGQFMLGLKSSGLGVSIQKGSFAMAVSPEAGCFLSDRLALCAGLGFTVSSTVTSSYSGTNFGLRFLPFVRYYIPFTEKLNFPINVAIGGGVNWTTGDIYYNSAGLNGAATAGVAVFPNPHLSLDFLAGYARSRYTSNISTVPVESSGAFVANWGATWYFGK